MRLEEATNTDDAGPLDDTRRGESRFFINSAATEATLTYRDEHGEQQIGQGRMADLSNRGAKISVNRRIPSGTPGQLKIYVPSMDFEIKRQVVVRWQQPRDARTWWTGCKVSEGFDEDVIEGLAANNVLNRRRDPRYQVSKPARVRWELAEADQSATLTNFSKGGFCVQLKPSEVEDRSRLMLIIPGPEESIATVPARVMWQQQREDEWHVGCAFTTKDGFAQVRRYAEPPELKRRRYRRRRSPRRMSKWLAIAVIVLAIVQTIQLFATTPDAPARLAQAWSVYVVRPIRDTLLEITADTPDPYSPSPIDVTQDSDVSRKEVTQGGEQAEDRSSTAAVPVTTPDQPEPAWRPSG